MGAPDPIPSPPAAPDREHDSQADFSAKARTFTDWKRDSLWPILNAIIDWLNDWVAGIPIGKISDTDPSAVDVVRSSQWVETHATMAYTVSNTDPNNIQLTRPIGSPDELYSGILITFIPVATSDPASAVTITIGGLPSKVYSGGTHAGVGLVIQYNGASFDRVLSEVPLHKASTTATEDATVTNSSVSTYVDIGMEVSLTPPADGKVFVTLRGILLYMYRNSSYGRGMKHKFQKSTDDGATWVDMHDPITHPYSYAGDSSSGIVQAMGDLTWTDSNAAKGEEARYRFLFASYVSGKNATVYMFNGISAITAEHYSA